MAQTLRSLDSSNITQYLMTGLLVVAAFLIGVLITEVRYLKKGAPTGGTPTAAAGDTLPTPAPFDAKSVTPVASDEHVRGSNDAVITLIEYSDFECPFCKRHHATMNQIMKDYAGKVRWVYRHYPLSFHANAQKAGEASECVAKFGGNEAFWKFADAYYEKTIANGTGIAIEEMPKLAATIGVKEADVKKCMDSDEMAKKVQDQMADGARIGVSGTPGTVLLTKDGKGEMISGALPIEQIKPIIDRYLQ